MYHLIPLIITKGVFLHCALQESVNLVSLCNRLCGTTVGQLTGTCDSDEVSDTSVAVIV